ncbi:hypothetical protein OA851_00370 [SAR86 cluster bacterium]|nr:hypothetical protein [SAR86 cluster bacterium]
MRQRRPYDDQGDNLPFNGVDPDNLPYSMHTDWRGLRTRGNFFLAILGFMIYLFFIGWAVHWTTQPSDYTFPTSEEWYEAFDVEDKFNLEVVDVFECSSDDRYEYPGFIGIDRKNRQILHKFYSGAVELNSAYKTDFNVAESNVTASRILKIKSVDVNSKRVMNFNTLTGYAYIDKFDLNNNGKKYTEEYFEKWNCGTGKLNTSNKTNYGLM